MTRLNGDEGGFKLTGQALNCGVEELSHDSVPVLGKITVNRGWESRVEAATTLRCCSECCSPK